MARATGAHTIGGVESPRNYFGISIIIIRVGRLVVFESFTNQS